MRMSQRWSVGPLQRVTNFATENIFNSPEIPTKLPHIKHNKLCRDKDHMVENDSIKLIGG